MEGQTVEILVEDLRRGRWRGRTADNRLVFFEHARNFRGRLVDVRIHWTGPYTMIGVLEQVKTGAAAPAAEIA